MTTEAKKQWRAIQASNAPFARSGAASLLVGGSRLLVFGGVSDDGYLADLHEIDLDAKSGEHAWQQLKTQSRPSPRGYADMLSTDGGSSCLLFGGVGNGFDFRQDFYRLDVSSLAWTLIHGDSAELESADESKPSETKKESAVELPPERSVEGVRCIWLTDPLLTCFQLRARPCCCWQAACHVWRSVLRSLSCCVVLG